MAFKLEGEVGVKFQPFFFLPPPPKVKEVMFSPPSFCLFVCRISQKVVDGSGLNFLDMFGVWQGRTDSILVTIRIWIRLLEFILK